jgi:PAS domain S-box-containing protein
LTRLERAIGACAILLAMFGLALLDVGSGRIPAVICLLFLGVHGLGSALMIGYPRLRLLWTYRARMYRNVLDVLLVVLLLATTGGASSRFFLYLLYPVLAGALRWGRWGALSTALATLTAYSVFMLTALAGSEPEVTVQHLALRLLNLGIFAGLLGYVGSPMRLSSGAEEESSLAMILDGVADGVILCDQRGIVRSANEAAAVMFGRDQDEFRGLDVRELAPGFDPRTVLPSFGNGPEPVTPQRVAWELQGVRRDGTTFSAELTVGSLRLGTQRIYAAVVRDVSLRKERETEARRLLEIEIAEEERVRLVQDLHDGLLQTLTGAALQLKSVQSLMERDLDGAQARLSQVRTALASEQRELRFWASEVKPVLMGLQGERVHEQLSETLERIRGTWGVETELSFKVEKQLDPTLGQEAYRVVQEAVVNAVKHGGASFVQVDVGDSDDALMIWVRDNGRGFPFKGSFSPRELEEKRLGPVLLKHRIAALNGSLAIDSTTEGSVLEITIPLGAEH